jgi:hypothetical protein
VTHTKFGNVRAGHSKPLNHRKLIIDFVSACANAERSNDFSVKAFLADRISRVLNDLDAVSFLEWIAGDPAYSVYYYDVKEAGACAKPREVAALVLEAIAVDTMESLQKPD